eukprot:Opistho-2@68066
MRHPNIVLYMGCVMSPHLCIVQEFMAKGSVYDLLHKPETREYLSIQKKLAIAGDCIRGLDYLHQHRPVVLHRDMKSPNVLIDAHYVAKVADFGLSTFKKPEEGVVVGSLLWMAPEVMAGQYTTASDVYSFGVILWELIAEELPFSEYHTGNAEEFHNVIMPRVGTKGLRPTISADFPPQIAELVRSCWAQDATQRPSAKVVNDRLRALSH